MSKFIDFGDIIIKRSHINAVTIRDHQTLIVVKKGSIYPVNKSFESAKKMLVEKHRVMYCPEVCIDEQKNELYDLESDCVASYDTLELLEINCKELNLILKKYKKIEVKEIGVFDV